MLDEERKFFEENKAELIERSLGKFALIKGSELIGAYNTIEEALSEGARRFGLASFLVRQIAEKETEINIPALTLGILNANSTRSV